MITVAAKILVVEDERITAEDIKLGLQDAGFVVPAIVDSGEKAIKKAEDLKPDMVLMDIKLKGEMDGIEAAAQIRKLYNIPVIYLTAYSDEATVQRAKMAAPSESFKEETGLLKKPFDENELRNAIEVTLYRHKMEEEHEKLFSFLLKSANDGVIAVDSQGKIKFMNSVAEDWIGRSELDVVGKNLEGVLNMFTETSGARNESFKGDLISSDDSKSPVEGTVTSMRSENPDEDPFIVVFHRMAADV
jgi:PAS domain S-box-containing protein